ncbi:MAG TPA: transcription elongation factor GreA [Acidimicrobiales bacterium]|nr:transcription elongation factor GreA [Acidimicrobiales bacterium]
MGLSGPWLLRRAALGPSNATTARRQSLPRQQIAFWGVTDEPIHLTRATHERLEAELDDLTTRGRVEVARAIEAARALGDLSENGDYHAAKDAQGKMEARIRQLQKTLGEAQIVDSDVGRSSIVAPGTVVTIRYDGDDDVERFLVGSIEERHEEHNVVSPGSPLGQALLGKSAGDVVEYEAPGGSLRVHIVEIGG